VSAYRFLEDHQIGQFYYAAGTIASTADVGGTLPSGWAPTPNVDPIDAPAVTAFYDQGPVLPGKIVTQFSTTVVNPPATHWTSIGGGFWELTGLGASLAPQWAWRI
jgi:hypothetical protein